MLKQVSNKVILFVLFVMGNFAFYILINNLLAEGNGSNISYLPVN